MIEKLERHTRIEKGLTQDIKISCPPGQPEIVSKINELVDVVNKQDKVIKLLINGLECLAKDQQLMNTEIEIKG